MTFADDFVSKEGGLAEEYPSAFGITFTPMVSGIALTVLGLVGAAYLFTSKVAPARAKYQEAQTKQQEIQTQLDKTKSGNLDQKLADVNAELTEKQALKEQVTAMFTNENDLDTLLLDLNNFIAANQGELITYTPEAKSSLIEDAYLGEEVKGKLKRQGISLEIEGSFSQTKAIIRDIERLQPLLMVKSYSSSVSEKPKAILTSSNTEIVPKIEAKLKTQLQLDAILPLSKEELEAAAAAAAAPAAEAAPAEGEAK
jgi:cell fate (sporulation/competence/biofilm development) regulator YlbF (YheA/YmcA/DUF963 family)